jgi:hypothetical protein
LNLARAGGRKLIGKLLLTPYTLAGKPAGVAFLYGHTGPRRGRHPEKARAFATHEKST